MSETHSDRVIFRCQCGAKLGVPANSADRLVRCPKCGGSFPGPGAVTAFAKPIRRAGLQAAGSSGAPIRDHIVVGCPCGARLRAPASAIGKVVKCPKCESRLAVHGKGESDPGRQTEIAERLSSSAIEVLISDPAAGAAPGDDAN